MKNIYRLNLTHRLVLLQIPLGFSGGLPLLLYTVTIGYWLKKSGISLSIIGGFIFVTLPGTLRFLWAPLVDSIAIPYLTARLGRRRSWALVANCSIMLSVLGLSYLNPHRHISLMVAMAMAVAFFSATLDTVLDAYRTEMLPPEMLGFGTSVYIIGYNFACMMAGPGAIILAAYIGWEETYKAMACLGSVGILATLMGPNLDRARTEGRLRKTFSPRQAFLLLGHALRDFFLRPHVRLILTTFALYKLSEHLMSPMMMPFFIARGYSDFQIAWINNFFGYGAAMVGSLGAGFFIAHFGVIRILALGAVLICIFKGLYFFLYYSEPNLVALTITIALESAGMGLSNAAMVVYAAQQSLPPFLATQLAFLLSLGSVGRPFLAPLSGVAVDHLGWGPFFHLTMGVGLPAIALTCFLLTHQHVGYKAK